ncbi:MAG: CBS domain-containing protein [Thermoprotei archaeon]
MVKELYDNMVRPINADELATKARATMRSRKVRLLPVVDEENKLVGVIYRSTLLGLASTRSTLLVRDIMSLPKVIAYPEDNAEEVTKRMLKVDEWYAPVVKSKTDMTYIGIFGLEHMIEEYLRRGGPKLEIRLEQIMKTDLVTVKPTDPISVVWRKMIEKSYAGIPVVDDKMHFVGLVTQLDLLLSRAPALNLFLERIPASSAPEVSRVMNRNVIIAKPYTTLGEAAYTMLRLEIGRLPVADDAGILIGMVDREDIVRALME